jgi:diguanylate cyclase (GGDEF)-like protein
MSDPVMITGTASLVALVTGGAVHMLERRRLRRARRALQRSEQAREKLRHEMQALNQLFADTAARARSLDPAARDGLASDAFDPVSGLLHERFIAVLIQQRVAAARRRLLPVAVVALEADGLRGTDQFNIDGAMRALGSVVRETFREADCACRVGDVVVIAALDDTTEDGARIAIERVQIGLRRKTGDVGITVSAGIACYPTHALDAPDLVARAGEALLEARSTGTSRVATASGETRPT